MKYQVAYLSNAYGTSKLVQSIKEFLPKSDTKFVDLALQQPSLNSEVYLIVFDYWRGTPPLKILDLLVDLEGKRILLVVTSALAFSDGYKEQTEQKVTPFLPDSCDYRGMFLCAEELPEHIVERTKQLCADPTSSAYASMILKNHEQTQGHPDEDDVRQLLRFIRKNM